MTRILCAAGSCRSADWGEACTDYAPPHVRQRHITEQGAIQCHLIIFTKLSNLRSISIRAQICGHCARVFLIFELKYMVQTHTRPGRWTGAFLSVFDSKTLKIVPVSWMQYYKLIPEELKLGTVTDAIMCRIATSNCWYISHAYIYVFLTLVMHIG